MEFTQRSISQHFILVVVALQVVMYATLFFNFELARIVIGIAYLTFIPGFLLIKILKLDNLGVVESFIFSVGFSVAFLMFAGLIINQFGYLAGITFPLATLPLSLFINTLIIVSAVIAHLRQGKAKPPTLPPVNFTAPMLLLLLIPVLGIVGAYYVNVTGNNIFLLLTIIGIAALFSASVFFKRTTKFYAFAVLMIALALLLMVSISTTYILPYGGDSPVEMYVFRTTQLNQHWNPIFQPLDEAYGRYNAMLSITILPTVYSNMLGLDATWVYKIIYPLIFALVPVGLYVLWQPYIGKKLSFVAAFLFMAQSTFFTEMLALNRQMIGELFFVLLLVVLLNKNLKQQGKFIAFAILGFGLIFSHYALAEIFMFLIFAAWAASVFYLRKPSFNLQLSMIVFFFVAMFAWYIYTSGSVVFDSFISFAGYIGAHLNEFFNPASRGQAVLTGLGLAQSPSFLNTISRGFAYLTEIFIVLGIFALLRKKMPFKFERDYKVFSVLTVIFLVLLTLIPGLANALSMTRFYHILLMILAPFCIVGMWLAAQFLFKRKKELMLSVIIIGVLVPYFLFQTNFVYEIAGTESWSVPLSGYRMDPSQLYGYDGYIDAYSVYGAEWVSNYTHYEYNIAGDNALYTSLPAYGLIYRGYIYELNSFTVLHQGEYAYLSYISIRYEPESSNGTLPRLLNQTDVIYSNGGSEVYYVP